MRVRFTRDMGLYEAGNIYDLPDHLARRALQINRAERATETATHRPPENAATRTKRPEEEPGVCGAGKSNGGVCQRQTQGGRCWQHEEG